MIVSTWIIDPSGVRPLGESPRRRPGQHAVANDATRRARARGEVARRRAARRGGAFVIHYHGGPITPVDAAVALWTGRHGLTSFEYPTQVALMFEVCQSGVVDCGAFTIWLEAMRERAAGREPTRTRVDLPAYAVFVRSWEKHPGFDFAIIPDDIEGTEEDNAKLCAQWLQQSPRLKPAVPVWHLHESLDRLAYLIRCVEAGVYERVALGSSGRWSTPGTDEWWQRMEDVREVACDSEGRPHVRLHGLRMLNPTIFAHIPLASADSCNVARNIGIDTKWSGTYQPLTERTRSIVLAERIERHASARTWSRRVGTQQNLELIG